MPPGPVNHPPGDLHVAAVQPQVTVLGAKTRPKKIVLVASDGTEHPFLLKVTTMIITSSYVDMKTAH